MSSQPPKLKWYSYWPKWRRIMLSGALILLAGALVRAIMGPDDAPAWLPNASLVIGYGFLAYGFFLRMRARHITSDPPKLTGETKTGWTDAADEARDEENS